LKRSVDLFAGCGGLSLGFQDAGFEIVGAFEWWGVAAACYEANFAHPVYRDDLFEVDAAVEKIQALNPEVLIGGPPCQDFSHAGKRVEDKRAALTEAFAAIVTTIKPTWFVMENVDRAFKSCTYAAARDIFKNAGYGLTEIVLNAGLCGVPQRRKRFFCIGSLDAEDGFLADYILNAMSRTEMTLRDYFGTSLDLEYYYRHPRNYCRRAIYSIDEPSATIRGVNRPVPLGYPGHPNDACELNDSIRPMTTLERALIQTFPPNFKWSGNKTETEQMIGNAVPVKLAEFVARALSHHISSTDGLGKTSASKSRVDYRLFHEWLQNTRAMSERAQRDTISRLKRANSICAIPTNPEAYYIFSLGQTDEYRGLKPDIRSQLKRAVSLYSDYRRACATMRPVL
jgi:DNA (cytosine-5)-methyltransferase 1